MRIKGFLVKCCLGYALLIVSIFPSTSQVIVDVSEINSSFDEQHPLLSPLGDLYFTKAFHPENLAGTADLGDIWTSKGSNGKDFQKPTQVKELSSPGYDVVVGFLEENLLLVYHDGRGKKQGIHQYSGSGNSWKHEKQLELGSFRNQSAHFSGRLSSSGEIMVMSLNSFGSYGNEDIYVSFLKDNGNWSTPQNLGPGINSYRQEMTPYLSVDSRVLYFSSNGHGSTGGVDIFYSERLDETWENWSEPKLLSQGNTKGVELSYFLLNGADNMAIYTSTQNSEGYGDLHFFQSERPIMTQKDENPVPREEKPIKDVVVAELKGKPSIAKVSPIQEISPKPMEQKSEENRPVEDSVTLRNSGTNVNPDTISPENPSQILNLTVLDINTLTSVDYGITLLDQTGKRSPKIQDENLSEIDWTTVKEIIVSSKGYLPLNINVDQNRKLPDPILLTPATQGLSMVMEKVLFKRGTADLVNEESETYLQSMADFLKENSGIKILLEGHTDNMGNVVLNKELSLDRASRIRDFLVMQGVEFERIRVNGWGGSKPISTNQDEEGRSKNRRVEMVILEE